MMKSWRSLLALLLVFGLVAAACGSDSDDAASDSGDAAESSDSGDSGDAMADDGEAVALDYWLWDGNQQPFYEECAAAFTAENPNITVNISQFGWGDYWDGLTAAFASDTVSKETLRIRASRPTRSCAFTIKAPPR